MSDSSDKPAPPQTPIPPAPPAAETPMPAPAPDESGQRWQARAEKAERELALRRALNGIDWFDANDAYRELSQHAERDEAGNWHVLMPDVAGEKRKLPPAEAARELAERKPHWVRAKVLGGSGAGDGFGSATAHASGVTYADLLKPENRGKLREYLYDRPDELERLRQAHFK